VVTDLAGRRLGEPQGPLMEERVLDVEVLRVVEDGDRPAGVGGGVAGGGTVGGGAGVAIGRAFRGDGDGVERDGLVAVDGGRHDDRRGWN
jgi:hypothetical protein